MASAIKSEGNGNPNHIATSQANLLGETPSLDHAQINTRAEQKPSSVIRTQQQLEQEIASLSEQVKKLDENLDSVIVGMNEARRLMIVSALVNRHILLEGVPGLGKTLLCNAFAQSLGLEFQRIQFTPDLTASDILGFQRPTASGEFSFQKGPIFGNIILADEINRAPGKTQSALLEAMQEGQVTVDRETYKLPRPFLVLATQNPLESSSATYPLPDAQLDRIGVQVMIPYPSEDELLEIAIRDTGSNPQQPKELFTKNEAEELFKHGQVLARGVQIEREIVKSVVSMCRALNPRELNKSDISPITADNIIQGPSPRAVGTLLRYAQGMAVLEGRSYVTTDDIQAVALPVLRHRMQLSDTAYSKDITPTQIIEKAVDKFFGSSKRQ